MAVSRSQEQKHHRGTMASRHTVAIGTYSTDSGRVSCYDIRLTNAGHQASSRKRKAEYDPDEEKEEDEEEE